MNRYEEDDDSTSINTQSQQYNESKINTKIKTLDAQRYGLIRQIAEQTITDKKIHQLDQDLTHLQRYTTIKIDEIDTFLAQKERFIERYNHGAATASSNDPDRGADEEVDRDLNLVYSKRGILSKAWNECPTCGDQVLRSMLSDHMKACSVITSKPPSSSMGPAIDTTSTSIGRTSKFPYNPVRPKPPRNLRIKAVDYSTITIEWDPSIFDGGEPIINYEVVYYVIDLPPPISSKTILENPPKKLKQKFVEQCARFCLVDPIPETDYVLDHMVAGKMYSDVKLRCRNKVGWSDFCQKIENVTTADPIKPLVPQYFTITTVTSASIRLEWSPPFHCGGGVLRGYKLSYLESVIDENQVAGKQPKKFHMKQITINLSADKTSFDLQDLKGDTLYSEFQLSASSNFGLVSDTTTCPDVRTNKPSRLQCLVNEIEWVKSSKEEYFDTDLFQAGVMQRERRSDYLTKLQEELRKLQSDRANNEEDTKEVDSDVDDSVDSAPKVLDRREQNYHLRIAALRSEIIDCEKSIEENMATRALLSSKLPLAQESLLSLKAEIKRISGVTMKYVNSSVLHAAEQKFLTVELRLQLKKKIDEELSSIEMWKTDITLKECEHRELSELLDKKKGRLSERRAALLIFQKQMSCSFHLRSNISGKPEDILRRKFSVWLLLARRSKNLRGLCNRFDLLISRVKARHAFSRWRDDTGYHLRVLELKKGKSEIKSKGGMLLVEAEVASIDTCESIKSFMRTLHQSSIASNECYKRDQYSAKDTFQLVKGDYHFHLQEYKTALTFYKAAFEDLFTPGAPSSQDTELKCSLIDKVGRALIHLNSWNEAILNYDDLLYLSKDVKNEKYIIIAKIRLGECYLFTGEISMAKKQYISCIRNGAATEYSNLHALATRGLEACQSANISHRQSNSQENDKDGFAGEIFEQIREGQRTADLIQAQIKNTSTKEGYKIELGRASCKEIRGKRICLLLEQDIKKQTAELSRVKKELKRLPQLISNIETELRCSPGPEQEGGGSGQMRTSSLLHGNAQTFQENELLKRLRIRLDESIEDLRNTKSTDKLLTVQIRNLEDELSTTQEDLKLEKGILMQTLLKKRSIRLMDFDRLYVSKDVVDGDDDDEYSDKMLIALTIDKDLFIHDALSGEALQVFEGDTISNNTNKSTGHIGAITSLYFEGIFVFTGSLDKTLRCWNIDTNELHYVSHGHEATITSICTTTSYIYTGSVDRTIIEWDKKHGKKIQRLVGHSRGILSLCKGNLNIVSGDGDGDIFVWDESLSIAHRLALISQHRVTILKSGKLEILSGDNKGFITMFWLKTGDILNQCKAHETSVADIEFDAIRIVSCGMDGCVKVIDVNSFEIIHTIRGQGQDLNPIPPILSLTFDSDKIVTLTKDGTICHWMWESRTDPNNGSKGDEKYQYQYHTVAPGETLAHIAKFHNTSIVNLVKWNVNQNMKRVQVGQKLIVGQAEGQTEIGDPEGMVNALKYKYSNHARSGSIKLRRQMPTSSAIATTPTLSSANKKDQNQNAKLELSTLACRLNQ